MDLRKVYLAASEPNLGTHPQHRSQVMLMRCRVKPHMVVRAGRTRWIGHGESAMEGLHTTSTRLVHSVFPGVFRAVWKAYAPVKEGAINVPSAVR